MALFRYIPELFAIASTVTGIGVGYYNMEDPIKCDITGISGFVNVSIFLLCSFSGITVGGTVLGVSYYIRYRRLKRMMGKKIV